MTKSHPYLVTCFCLLISVGVGAQGYDPHHWPYGPIPTELKPKFGQPQTTPPLLSFEYIQFAYGRTGKWDASPEGLVHNNKFYIFFCGEQQINGSRTDTIRVVHKNLPLLGGGYSNPITLITPLSVPWTGVSKFTLATGILPEGSACDPTVIYFPPTQRWYIYFSGTLRYDYPPYEHTLGQIRNGVAVSSTANVLSQYAPGQTWINLVPTTYQFDPDDTRWWFVHGVAQPSVYLNNNQIQFAVGDTSYYVPTPDEIVQRWRIINVGEWETPIIRSVVEPYRGDGWKFTWSMSVARYGAYVCLSTVDDAGHGYVICDGQHVGSILPDLIPGPRTERVTYTGFVRYSDGTLYTTTEGSITYGWLVFSMSCPVGVNCNSEHNIHLGRFRLP